MAGMWLVGEDLPQETNRVTLDPVVKDSNGMPVASVAWSTERVAEQTHERARELKLDVHALAVWYDVDDVEGLRRLRGEARRPRSAKRQLDPRQPNFTQGR